MKKSERTRQFIIEQSAPIINKKGMAGTSISDIMAATRLAKGGIYGNFESKDEICLETFSYLAQRLSNRLDELVSQGTSAKEKFFNLLSFYGDGPGYTEGGCPILNFGVEADDTHPVVRENVRKEISLMQARISNIMEHGIQNGEVSASLDTRAFSIRIFAALEGGVLIRRVFGNNEQMRSIVASIKKEFETYLR